MEILILALMALALVAGLRGKTFRLIAPAVAVALAGAGYASGATSARKSKQLDSVSGISATETDGTVWDTRGWRDVSFRVDVTAQTGGTADTNYFTCAILGCDTEGGTFTPIAMLSTGQLLAVGGEQMPDAASEFPILPRFIKVRWTETGTMTGFSATCTADFTQDAPGVEHSPGYQGG